MSRVNLTFPHGLPGFDHEHTFTLVEDSARAPLLILESEAAGGPHFYAVPVGAIDPAYEPQLSPDDLAALGLEQASGGLQFLALLALPENGPLTANLLAPVVVNPAARLAVQAVRMDQRYSHAHVVTRAEPGGAPCS